MRLSSILGVMLLGFSSTLHAADTQPTGAAVDQQKVEIGQHPQHLEGQVAGQPAQVNYLLFLPTDYGKDPGKKWPVMIFLHGSGERGEDLTLVAKHGPPKIVATQPDFPFILVSPQCPAKTWWQLPVLNMLLDHVLATTQADPDRVYLTGLSMGGFGTWAWAEAQPKRFAAIVPVCGGGDPSKVTALAKMPIWVFHGEADPAVPYQKSVDMVDALKALGSDVQFTHYPGVGHDCWTQTYANPKLYEWLLQQRRTSASAPATAPSTEASK